MPASNTKTTTYCPICEKETQVEYHPFCSKKCADIDLSRWFKGSYAIPAYATEIEDDNIPENILEDE